MARTLMDDMAADSAALVNEFAESVVYRPYGGTERTILAIVNRFPVDQLVGVSESFLPRIVLTVRNSSTAGISSTEIETGGDQVDVAMRYGDRPQTISIVRVVKSDAGLVSFEAR